MAFGLQPEAAETDKGTLFGYFEVAAMTGQPRNGETRMAWQLEKVNALLLGVKMVMKIGFICEEKQMVV